MDSGQPHSQAAECNKAIYIVPGPDYAQGEYSLLYTVCLSQKTKRLTVGLLLQGHAASIEIMTSLCLVRESV